MGTDSYLKPVETIERYTNRTVRSGGKPDHSRSNLQCFLSGKCICHCLDLRHVTVIVVGDDKRFLIVENGNRSSLFGAQSLSAGIVTEGE